MRLEGQDAGLLTRVSRFTHVYMYMFSLAWLAFGRGPFELSCGSSPSLH